LSSLAGKVTKHAGKDAGGKKKVCKMAESGKVVQHWTIPITMLHERK